MHIKKKEFPFHSNLGIGRIFSIKGVVQVDLGDLEKHAPHLERNTQYLSHSDKSVLIPHSEDVVQHLPVRKNKENVRLLESIAYSILEV